MHEVTKDEFYAVIHDQRLNVHPHPERHQTIWSYRGGRRVFGKESTGYASGHNERTRYFINSSPDPGEADVGEGE